MPQAEETSVNRFFDVSVIEIVPATVVQILALTHGVVMETSCSASARRKKSAIEGYKWNRSATASCGVVEGLVDQDLRSLVEIYVRVTVTWAQTTSGAEELVVVPVVQCPASPPSSARPPPCLRTSLLYSSAQCASTMCCHPSCNARAGTSSARAAAPSCPAAPRAAAPSATSATSLWKKSPVMWCSLANTPTQAAQLLSCTRRKRSMKKPVSSDRTPARVPGPPASGKGALTKSCLTWWCHIKVSQHSKGKILCFSQQTSICQALWTGWWCSRASIIISCWCWRNKRSLMATNSFLQSSNS